MITRSHRLHSDKVVFARQNPTAIDAGVFHNDVISVGNESVFLVHELAFIDQKIILEELRKKAGVALQIIEVSDSAVSLSEAVNSYLFNSQLVTLPDGKMALIAPQECESTPNVKLWLDELIADPNNPINAVHYLNLKQSMRNGGGPACLRLRVPLNNMELAAIHQTILVDDALIDQLSRWVMKHYRTTLHVNDLADPALMQESFQALDELTQLLKLGSLYPFQKDN